VGVIGSDVYEERDANIISVERVCRQGTTVEITGNRSRLGRNVGSNKSHTAPSQKTAFFIITAVKTSDFMNNFSLFMRQR
jgi:hypothetical protein